MIHEFPPSPASRKRDAAQIVRAIRSYAEFDRWMDRQLEILVDRWIHTAAPNASRPRRAQRQRH